jgi:hypothetical protein
MAGNDRRRSIFKKGKGRALLRFLIYLLLMFILVSVGYIIIASDGSDIARQGTAPTASVNAAALTPPPTPTPAPTPTPTPFVPDPSPEFEMGYSDEEEYGNIKNLKPGNAVTCGLLNIDAINGANFMASLEVSGYAYIEGADMANSTVFLLTFKEQGEPDKMYATQPDGSEGGDRERSAFKVKIDVTEYMEGSYNLGVAIFNGNRTECALLNGGNFNKNEMDEVETAP